MVESVKIVTADLESCYSSRCVLDPDAAQITTFAQEKSTDKNIRRLVTFDVYHLPKAKKVKPNHWLPYTPHTTHVNMNHDSKVDFFVSEG